MDGRSGGKEDVGIFLKETTPRLDEEGMGAKEKKKIVTARKTSHEAVERRRKKSCFSQEQMKEKERLWGAVGRRRSISCPY